MAQNAERGASLSSPLLSLFSLLSLSLSLSLSLQRMFSFSSPQRLVQGGRRQRLRQRKV